MHSIAVYLVQLAYGGPEEGGWFYQTGELCTDPELTAFGTTFADGHEARVKAMSDEVQAHLDRDWNTGDHAREISSVLSAGRFEARVHDGWPPSPSRQSVPVTNDPKMLGLLHIANFQESGPMKTFTVHCEYPAPYRAELTVEAEDLIGACRAAIDASHTTDGWKSLETEHLTYVTAIAEGADIDPWRFVPDGADASVLAVPRLFTDVAALAGFAATRSDDLVDQLRTMVDAIGADGGLRITPAAMVRLCATGKAILDDIACCGLSPTSSAAPSVGAVLPDAT